MHFNPLSLTFSFPFLTLSTPQVVKQRMQTGQFTSAPDAVRLIASKQGFKGFYAVCDPYLEIDRLTLFKYNVFNSREEFIILLFLVKG